MNKKRIDERFKEPIPQFNVGDEIADKTYGMKGVVTHQDGTTVSVWYPVLCQSTLGYKYVSPERQCYNAYEIKKTGKSYPQISEVLQELL